MSRLPRGLRGARRSKTTRDPFAAGVAAGLTLIVVASVVGVVVAASPSASASASASSGGQAFPRFDAGGTDGAYRNDEPRERASASVVGDAVGAAARRWVEDYVAARSPVALSDLFAGAEGGEGEPVSLRRALTHGDFDGLNSLLEGAVVKLPDASVNRQIVFATLDLKLTNIRCFDIEVHDVLISYEMKSQQKMDFSVKIDGLDLDCDANWRYNYGLLHDGGTVEFRSDDNDAETVIGFASLDYREHPPHESKVDSCKSTINISDKINIKGGDFVANVVNAFEGLVRGKVAEEIGKAVCGELGGLGSAAVSDMLDALSKVIDGYLIDLPADLADPMHAEKTMKVPDDVRLLDLSGAGGEGEDRDDGGGVAGWIGAALREVDDLLGKEVDDPTSPKGNGKDLGANKMLRSSLLDGDRAYVVPVSDWPESLANGGVLMRSHDMLTETTMQLTKLKILGLDTFTEVDPLNIVGKHTISNRFSWEYISFELDLKITMKPSTSSDSVIVSPGAKEQVEHIKIKTGVDNVRTALSLMLALDLNALGDIQLGSVMHLDQILPCLLSAFFAVELTELDVQVDDIQTPTIEGFISAGIDKILKTSSMAVFEMFESSLRKAAPGFFQITVRKMVNDMARSYMSDSASVDCPTYSGSPDEDPTVDFRDLFLPPDQAKAAGATGRSPYGDIGSTLMGLLDAQLLSADDEGYLKLNSALLRPATEAQSGTAGTLRFPGSLFELVKDRVPDVVWRAFATRMELSGSDARVRNLDTLRPPVSVLGPASVDPRMLVNNVNFGLTDPEANRPLGGSVRILLDIDDENSPLFMKNEVDVSVDVASTGLFADLLASVSERGLMEFPLKYVMNGQCWLATIPPPRLDENGLRFGDDDDVSGVSLSELALLLWSAKLGMECVDCSSSGAAKIPRVLAEYEEIGTVNKIKERLVDAAVELLKSPWLRGRLDRMLADAPKRCPYRSSYDAEFVPAASEASSAGSSPVTRDAVELIALAGGAALGVIGVAGAESHLAFDPAPADPLSAEAALAVPEGTNLLSFTALDGYAERALDDVRAALGSNVEDPNGPNADTTGEDLLINVLLRNELLDDDRALGIPVNRSLEEAGFMVGLETVRVFGLDTFTSFEVLDVIGNHTFTNKFTLASVAVELDVVIDMTPPESSQGRRSLESETLEHMLFRLTMQDLDASAAVFLAIDQDRLFDLPLGSILYAKQVVGCLLSSTFDMEVTDLSATLGDLDEPTFTGFLSDNLRDDISEALRAVLTKYKSAMLDAAPNLFGVTVRHILNNIADSFLSEDTSQYCPPPVVPPEFPDFVDFRDLILPPTQAAAAGGRGDAPYGDLASKIINIIDERLLSSVAEDGTPKVNEAVIRPFTLEQSGTEGEIQFEEDLANFASEVDFAGIGGIQFRASNTSISNLDSFGYPLELLKPRETIPFTLDNNATVGVGPEPLRGSLRLLLEVSSGDPNLAMSNELQLGMDVKSANLFAAILAKMGENEFLHFPLGDIMIPQCWLATIATPVLDSMGLRDESLEPSLALEEFALAIASLHFNVSCIECSTAGLVELPDIIKTLEEAGTVSEWKGRLVDFSVELIQSDLVQTQIDRILADAPKQCPHNPAYEEAFLPTQYDDIGPFDLSRESVEFVIYSGVVVFESVVVVVAKTHSTYETQVQDPLSGQKSLEVPSDVRLLDLEDLGASIGSWADSILDEASNFFAGTVDDASSPTGKDLAVNVFLRSWLLDEDGALVLAFDDVGVETGGFMVSLQSVKIHGLDTFTAFDALEVIGSQTLLNNFRLKKLGVEVTLALDMDPETQDDTEYMTFDITMTDIKATVALLVALDLDRLGSMPLGSILRTEQILSCALSAMHAVNLTQFSVSVGDISEPSIDGFISPDMHKAIGKVSQAIFGEYKSDMLEGIPNFFDVTVRALLNNVLHDYISKESSVSCPPLVSSDASNVLDLRDLLMPESDAIALGASGKSPYGDLFRSVKSLLDEEVLAVDPETGLSKVNDMVIGPLTKKQSNITGMLRYPNDLVGGKKRLAVGNFKADAEFRLNNIRIEHLDTVGHPLELLQPVEPHVLNNTAAIGVASDPLRLTMSILFSLQAEDGTDMRNEFDLGVDLETAVVILGALVEISEGPFFSFPLRDITNFNCWLATIAAPALDSYGVRVNGIDPTLALQHLSASLQRLQLRVDCIDCSSPGLRDISELLASPQAVEDSTSTANRVLNYITGLLGGRFMQIKIDRMLRDATAKCPHRDDFVADFDGYSYQPFESPEMEESSLSFFVAMAIVAVVIFALAAVAFFTVKRVVWRRHRRWLKTKTEEEIFHIHMTQMHEAKQEEELCRRTSSMFRSKAIPLALRVLMPVIILGNIAFFLSGHLSKGASVGIRLHLGGKDVDIEDFFVFSIARSTVDMWKAGAKELAMLILIFSGIWPYTKQLITLVLWFMPPSRLSVSRRGSIFLWLDVLGKWSMIDIFVLLVCLAAFRVSISSPDLAFLPKDVYSLDLAVIPLWGLYANMTAQLISQVSSHFIIYYHRKIADAAAEQEHNGQLSRYTENTKSCDDTSGVAKSEGCVRFTEEEESVEHRQALCEHRFELTCDKEGRHATVRQWVNRAPPVAALLILALIIWGCIWTSFSLEVHGLVGLAVESGQGFRQAERQYNLFSLARALMDQARFLDVGRWYLGLGILASLLVITVLLVPLFQVAMLLWIWFGKLTDKRRKFAKAIVEGLQAWQYVEVYILSIIVGAWQIGGVSGFMVNDYCDALEETFAELAYYGIISESDAQCFRVDAKLEGACFVLLVAAIFLGFLNHFVMKALDQQTHDIETAGKIDVLAFKEGTTFVDDDLGASSRAAKIKPIPPRFTDSYRWLTELEEPFEPFYGDTSRLTLDVTADFVKESPSQASSVPSRDGSDSYIDAENGAFGISEDDKGSSHITA